MVFVEEVLQDAFLFNIPGLWDSRQQWSEALKGAPVACLDTRIKINSGYERLLGFSEHTKSEHHFVNPHFGQVQYLLVAVLADL